ncbi:DUF4124 domain-containing protein [Candidatus Halobeggiatoa sp. HSG11]|nr:DUF4124 domain-containing protein [Candidatus Halobeggiatoa sp. HSG11]
MKILFILLIFTTAIANAKIYQCQDADGNMQYTQTPTAECLQENTTPEGQFVISGPETPEEEPQEAPQEPSETDVKNLSPKEIAEKNAEILKKNCTNAHNALTSLNSFTFDGDSFVSKDGTKVVVKNDANIQYTEETRNQEMTKIQKYIDGNCVDKQPDSGNP